MISSDDEGERKKNTLKKNLSLSSDMNRLANTKLRGDCSFKDLAQGIRLTLKAALIIMEVHNLKKWRAIFKAEDLIYKRNQVILTDYERI